MSSMIQTAPDFQYSVNIAYDLNDDEKIKNFIPTKSSLELLESILLSADEKSTNRARLLVGAYGKGKSQIVLNILAILMRRDKNLFVHLNDALAENERLRQIIDNYYDSGKKFLPVLISGSGTSLTQNFILSLQQSLRENDLLDVMPETNYEAAANVIEKWKVDYPETYKKFESLADGSASQLAARLQNFDIDAYKIFEEQYPALTSGSVFNPFLGFDVVELYESIAKALRPRGYAGLYVVYDEFSKYLEANIAQASVSDTKMLQDFAEKCSRSGERQMHIMLISHKELENYIDKLPKQKVDGWRGISERFEHVYLNNNFTQVYDIIGAVIKKDKSLWQPFVKAHDARFAALLEKYKSHAMFEEFSADERDRLFKSCYPLHPVSMFILPRLSERVAQNERTLFTFLSLEGSSTLPSFLKHYDDKTFLPLTPDIIYDYFEPLLQKNFDSETVRTLYVLTSSILAKLPAKRILERKIIKTISLIYIIEQFETLKPLKEEILAIFSETFSSDKIAGALSYLESESYVLYIRESNSYLKLKESSGIDINKSIADEIERERVTFVLKDNLNNFNINNYFYPSRYNDDKNMIRYFQFTFIDEREAALDVDWAIKSESIDGDGALYAVLPQSDDSIKTLQANAKKITAENKAIVLVVPKRFIDIEEAARKYSAVSKLKERSAGDSVLFDEYEVLYEDISERLDNYINNFTRPEMGNALYFSGGERQDIRRASQLSNLLSTICEKLYPNAPVIKNETINKNALTATAAKSRDKVVAALLRNPLEENLGLTGTGQDVSIMRSALLNTGVLSRSNPAAITLNPSAVERGYDSNLRPLLHEINKFIKSARNKERAQCSALYKTLTGIESKIGARKGYIPIYLAAVLRGYKKEVAIWRGAEEVPLSAETLARLNEAPDEYSIRYLEWDKSKEDYVKRLEKLFKDFVMPQEKESGSFDYVASAMRRWYMALPKYAKEIKASCDGENVKKSHGDFLKAMRQNVGAQELLFVKIPKIFDKKDHENSFGDELCGDIREAKAYYDSALEALKKHLAEKLKALFCKTSETKQLKKMSVTSVVKDWCAALDKNVFAQLFQDGTDKCLALFKSAGNDDDALLSQLAKLASGLRLEDWDGRTEGQFFARVKTYKNTAEGFKAAGENAAQADGSYELVFNKRNDAPVLKRFDKIAVSGHGKLLHNKIVYDMDSMGLAVTQAEKRQVLMDILQEIC